MTDSIDALLHSEAGKKAVKAAYLAAPTLAFAETRPALRAFLSSLAEQGAMREAYGYDGFLGEDNWQTYTSESHVRTRDFPAFILRRE
jgi:hypothetical protein